MGFEPTIFAVTERYVNHYTTRPFISGFIVACRLVEPHLISNDVKFFCCLPTPEPLNLSISIDILFHVNSRYLACGAIPNPLQAILTAEAKPTIRVITSYYIFVQYVFVVPTEGVEPPTFGLQNRCTAYCAKLAFTLKLESVVGIDPTSSAWKADIIPLYYTDLYIIARVSFIKTFERMCLFEYTFRILFFRSVCFK